MIDRYVFIYFCSRLPQPFNSCVCACVRACAVLLIQHLKQNSHSIFPNSTGLKSYIFVSMMALLLFYFSQELVPHSFTLSINKNISHTMHDARFETLTAVWMIIQVLWDMTPCKLLKLPMFQRRYCMITLQKNATRNSKTSITFHQLTYHHIPEDLKSSDISDLSLYQINIPHSNWKCELEVRLCQHTLVYNCWSSTMSIGR